MKKTIPEDAILIPDNAIRVYDGLVFQVYQWPQVQFDGSTETFELVKRPDTVKVLGVVGDKVVVVDEDQPHRGSRKSLPGGRVEKEDGDPEAAARREALEETGYEFENWRHIGTGQLSTQMEWFTHLYLAWGAMLPPRALHPDVGESIVASLVSIEELKYLLHAQGAQASYLSQVLEPISTAEDLLRLPRFIGVEVDR